MNQFYIILVIGGLLGIAHVMTEPQHHWSSDGVADHKYKKWQRTFLILWAILALSVAARVAPLLFNL